MTVLLKNGWTALIKAAQEGRCDVCSLMLDRGANIEAKDEVGEQILYFLFRVLLLYIF
jgi:ankyrin repeat protein